ncbi:rhodanese-like domain-containing protein [Streptomyces sp. NBC_01102]|uniref:rhodanese-like domain-containing protein n=1 Tax=Streptomyces sp. NBC_01102 TaxID=2903749 RepID=UPI00386D21BC|nr:rhodanese-like domain-containing protein [Streptomyces sp. NBC_01102]
MAGAPSTSKDGICHDRDHHLHIDQARTRLHELTVIDVRTPGEYAGGHLPGALNIPLDRIQQVLPDIRHAVDRGDVLVVCAPGARSRNACRILAGSGIGAATLSGGTGAWAADGHDLHRPRGATRARWGMERQVRFAAGTVVLPGLLAGFLVHPAFQVVSAGIAAEEVEPVTGQVVGFVLTGDGSSTVYVSGDNASLDAVRQIAERFGPVDTAVLFAGPPRLPVVFEGGLVVLDSAQTAQATEILGARRVVPAHHDSRTHFTQGRKELEAAFTAAGPADRLDPDRLQRG